MRSRNSYMEYKMDKDKIIAHVYNDRLGFGSSHNTLKDARKLDSSITLQAIAKWKESNIERTTQLKAITPIFQEHPSKSITLIYFL